MRQSSTTGQMAGLVWPGNSKIFLISIGLGHTQTAMARQSLVEYFSEYARRGNEPAIASFSGYRVDRWTYGRIAEEARRFAREPEARRVGQYVSDSG
jgi:hypothetical protein